MHLADYRAADLKLVPTRNGFGEGLIEAGRNHNVLGICADLAESTRFEGFKKAYPGQYIEIGVSEQMLVAIDDVQALQAFGKVRIERVEFELHPRGEKRETFEQTLDIGVRALDALHTQPGGDARIGTRELRTHLATALKTSAIENTWSGTAARIYRNWLEQILARKNVSQCRDHAKMA